MSIKRGDMPANPCQQTLNRTTGELQPHQFGNDDFVVAGMTIRERFALAAMQAIISNPKLTDRLTYDGDMDFVVNRAYRQADRMLRGDQ